MPHQGQRGMHHQMGRHPSFHMPGLANAFQFQPQPQFQNPFVVQQQQNFGFQNRPPQQGFGFQIPQQQGFQQHGAYQPGFQQFGQPGPQSGFIQPQPQNFNPHPQYGGQGGSNVNYF